MVPPGKSPSAASSGEGAGEVPTTISLGGFGPNLREQGFDKLLPSERVDYFMRCDTAITLLHVAGLVPYGQHVKSRQKLAKMIDKEVIAGRALGREDAAEDAATGAQATGGTPPPSPSQPQSQETM